MPLNPFDASFFSFQKQIIPEAQRLGMAVLGMKPLCGAGDPVKKGVFSPEEALRYAMSVPGVTVTITGMDKPEVLHQNLQIAQNFRPMQEAEMRTIETRVQSKAADGRFERYRTAVQLHERAHQGKPKARAAVVRAK